MTVKFCSLFFYYYFHISPLSHQHTPIFYQAYEDAVLSIELDEKNVKGHLLTGQALAELGKMEQGTEKLKLALKRMTKALSLCSSQGLQAFEKDVQINIYKAKKTLWLKELEIKRTEAMNFYKYLTVILGY